MNKKNIFKILIINILIVCFFPMIISANVIIEKKDTDIISSGVIRYNYKQFTTSGWQNINVVEVDLKNDNVKLNLLISDKGINNFDTISNMAKSQNAIAAINADFFSWDTSTTGFPIGFAMKDGEVVSSTYYKNAVQNTMATFSINDLKETFITYLNNEINIITPNGAAIKVGDINKRSETYELPNIYTPNWNSVSIGTSKFNDMVEIVVEDDIVVEIRNGQPAVAIPKNGYVISARGWSAESLLANFYVGSPISYTVNVLPNLYNSKMAVSGGAILLNTGQIPNFTHNINGTVARTALGISQDNRYLYLVTVDGGQALSKGMNMLELANFLIKIGCYNAINLDGGGSTSMVTRDLFSNSLVSNNVGKTFSQYRKVANGIGVFSTTQKGNLAGLIIKTSEKNLFPNTKREFSISGYDENYNPIDIDTSKVQWTVKGVDGSFQGNIFTATSSGNATIVAKLDNIECEYNIKVLSTPIKVDITPREVKTKIGSNVRLVVRGKDVNGFYSYINLDGLDVRLSNDIGELKGNLFYANKVGNALLTFKFGETISYAGINVTSEKNDTDTETISIPGNSSLKDPANKKVELKSSDTSFKFAVFGNMKQSKTLMEKIYENRVINKIDSSIELISFVGNQNNSALKSINKQKIGGTNGYEIKTYKNCTFISVNNSEEGSIRKTNSQQWFYIMNDLEKIKSDNIFILLPIALHDGVDYNEALLLQEYLSEFRQRTGKNVWVLAKRTSALRGTIDDGIQFLYTRDITSSVNTEINAELNKAQYLVISVNGKEISYEIKNLF